MSLVQWQAGPLWYAGHTLTHTQTNIHTHPDTGSCVLFPLATEVQYLRVRLDKTNTLLHSSVPHSLSPIVLPLSPSPLQLPDVTGTDSTLLHADTVKHQMLKQRFCERKEKKIKVLKLLGIRISPSSQFKFMCIVPNHNRSCLETLYK